LFVALDPWRERLVGMAGAYIADTDDEIARIFSVYVTPAYRGTAGGVGEPVINATVEWLRGTGVQAVRLKVYQDNACAVALYRRLGFVETDQISDSARDESRKLAVMSLESFR
jgi:ribosomal protein S18 acetylase RimI-like enzyme